MHPATFGKRVSSSRILISKNRPPPLKSCLAASDSDRDFPPSGEHCVRKTVHFPDDKCFLERVREIPCRPNRNKKALFKTGRLAETKSFIMYTSNPLGSNQRFLSKPPGSSGPQYTTHSPWSSVVRARYLAAKYSSAPGSPRSAPSSDGDGSPSESSFDMSSLKDTLLEPTPSSSLHESFFDMSSVIHALPDPDVTFDMSSLADSLPDTSAFNMSSLMDALPKVSPPGSPDGVASDMSSLMRALPDLDAPSVASSLERAPKSMVATHSCESSNLPPKVHVRVVQTRVQVGPFSATSFIDLCGLMALLGSFFPCLAPVLVLLFIYGTCFF